mgnify:CR=1 FL=1
MTPEEIDAIETRWAVGGFLFYNAEDAKKIQAAAEDIGRLLAHSKKLALQNEWLKDEVSSVQKIGLENVQQLVQAVNEAKELRATVDHLHTILGKKEYELQKLREKLAPFLNQEEK